MDPVKKKLIIFTARGAGVASGWRLAHLARRAVAARTGVLQHGRGPMSGYTLYGNRKGSMVVEAALTADRRGFDEGCKIRRTASPEFRTLNPAGKVPGAQARCGPVIAESACRSCWRLDDHVSPRAGLLPAQWIDRALKCGFAWLNLHGRPKFFPPRCAIYYPNATRWTEPQAAEAIKAGRRRSTWAAISQLAPGGSRPVPARSDHDHH